MALLSKINYKAPRSMLLEDLADNGNVIAQLRALDQLADKPDKEAVEKMRAALRSAGHYSVRIRAAEVLQQARSDEALAALKESQTQPDARVRNAVVKALGGFYERTARLALEQCIANEKNPGITATALRGLAAYSAEETRALLSKHLMIPTYKERLSSAALGAIKAQEDPGMLEPIFALLEKRSKTLPSNILSASLETVGVLVRNLPNKDAGRNLLLSYLNHPKEQVRIGALTGLGNSEDPRAISVLETYINISEYKPEKGAADKALERIRSSQKPNEELKNVRSEVTKLQDMNRELKKEFETLRKKFESKP
jgi:aminopeptidase N